MYPETASEVIDEKIKYKKEVISAMKAFKKEKPYRGTLDEREAKFQRLNEKLNEIYHKNTKLIFENIDGSRSDLSRYNIVLDEITLSGKLSIVTYLHEYAHSIFGISERKAVSWSLNSFKRIYPILFENLSQEQHMVRVNRNVENREVHVSGHIRELENP